MFQRLTLCSLLYPASRLALTQDDKRKFRDLMQANRLDEAKGFTRFYKWYQPQNFKHCVDLVYKGVAQGYLMGDEVADLDSNVKALFECYGIFHSKEYSDIAKKLYIEH